MRKIKRMAVLLTALFIMVLSACAISAQERAVYVGDLIHLEIPKGQVTEAQIREAFKDIDVVAVEADGDYYEVTVRSFEVGEQQFNLAGQTIMLQVASILEADKRDSIYEGSFDLADPDINIYWELLLGIALIGFLASGALLLIKNRRRKVEVLSPYEQLNLWISLLESDSTHYFVKLSDHLKWYLQMRCGLPVMDKTSREVIVESQDMPWGTLAHQRLEDWLMRCDVYKFSGENPDGETRATMKSQLIMMVNGIEAAMQKTEVAQ